MHQFYSLCSQIIGGIVVCLLIISFSVTLTLNFRPLYYDVGVKTINKFNPIPYSTLKNSYFVVYRRGLGNI